MNSNREKIKNMTYIALFVAIISVVSQISIPTPTSVPITLQIFVVAFAGFFLGIKRGIIGILLYISLGMVGAPVFAGFRGGFSTLLGPSGGFIWGFIVVVLFCSLLPERKISITLGILSVLICHAFGTVQYMLVAKTTFLVSFLAVSLPFIIKDIVLIPFAYLLSQKMKKIVKKK